MGERIPQRIDYHRYTEQGVVLDGFISLSESIKDLPRLNNAIIENAGDINYHLEFDTDILGNRFVTGQVEGQVVLQCQRCMDNYTVDLNCNISIAFVKNELEQTQAEESNYDVFWLEKKELFDPRVLLEDELLLALPQIPMHLESQIGEECDVHVEFLGETDDSSIIDNTTEALNNSEQNDKDNPFAILKQLKK
ncbi:MAG: YceD family protein [Gammaproteobacteria bacterium]|nr:YceD family protein [Gammaproteobacteria bacterium]